MPGFVVQGHICTFTILSIFLYIVIYTLLYILFIISVLLPILYACLHFNTRTNSLCV